MAKVALVTLNWDLSPSLDVQSQTVRVVATVLDGTVVLDESQELDSFSTTYQVTIPEKTLVHVELTASDGVNTSPPATLDFEITDLNAPQAPSNLTYTLEVVEETS